MRLATLTKKNPNRIKVLSSHVKSTPTAEYVDITPDQATEWLDKAGRNRKLSNRVVNKYAAAMSRGDWLVTSQGICFDEFGKLIDGQHRLSAIAASGKTIRMLVIKATTGRSQLVLDQGWSRRPHDQIALREGWEVKPLHIAIAKSMITGTGGPGETIRRLISTDIQQLDRFYVRHHKAIESVAHYTMGKHTPIKGVTIAPVIAPMARAFYTAEIEQLTRFGEIIATGMADSPGDGPAIVLRNWLINGRDSKLSSRRAGDRYLIYKKAEIALNAFLKGESIERLGQRQLETELFPIPDDKIWAQLIKEGEGNE